MCVLIVRVLQVLDGVGPRALLLRELREQLLDVPFPVREKKNGSRTVIQPAARETSGVTRQLIVPCVSGWRVELVQQSFERRQRL